MRVIHIVPAITEEASGPSYSVVSLCKTLREAGVDITLTAMDWAPIRSAPAFLKVFPIGFGPRRLGRSPAMCRWLRREVAAGAVEILHNHGMWQMNAVYPGWAARGRQTKLMVSPRGAFSPWAMNHGSAFKTLFWRALQRPSLMRAVCFHATAEAEYHDIRRLGFFQPVAIIPNGIDVPTLARSAHARQRTLLYLGRIHPIKGIDLLLHAWATVMGRFPDWQLVIAGPATGYHDRLDYLEELKALADSLRLERIRFGAPLYGADKLAAYREADLFVLPTRSDNFGITVAEALAAGTPAIVTKGAPWQGLQSNDAGWWVDIGVEPLVAALEEAMAAPREQLAQRGINGRDWMLRDFSWHNLAAQMHRTYLWLLGQGEPPPCVKVN